MSVQSFEILVYAGFVFNLLSLAISVYALSEAKRADDAAMYAQHRLKAAEERYNKALGLRPSTWGWTEFD